MSVFSCKGRMSKQRFEGHWLLSFSILLPSTITIIVLISIYYGFINYMAGVQRSLQFLFENDCLDEQTQIKGANGQEKLDALNYRTRSALALLLLSIA